MIATVSKLEMKPSHADFENITPAKAEQFLKTMVGNRPVSETKKWEYAYAIDEGRWSLNGESLKFDSQGRMFDGQHRCLACILADKPFITYVTRGISDENAFSTVDTGKTRTHADIFGIAGWQNNKTASGAAMLVYAYQNKRLSIGGVTGRLLRKDSPLAAKMVRRPNAGVVSREELIEFATDIGEELQAAVRFANSSKAARVMPATTVAGLYYLFRERARYEADRFFTDLGEGVGLQKIDPVYVLREKLLVSKTSKAKLTRWAQIAFTIKAWNARRNNDSMHTLRMVEGEKFPVIK